MTALVFNVNAGVLSCIGNVFIEQQSWLATGLSCIENAAHKRQS
ncbi:hypothetical protein SAMN04488505_1011129 [Chitinophaga rupis]|uniref:Uncharacterized protein n=1 Tax=Chitinophaga rupis TaxID=573321 RepID=A0A1H7KZL3_9BACT|nr:hypothetical protein SAMN04488505_1011129 [Chitinophaga rupis]